MIFKRYKDFKTPKFSQFGALAGQIQQMAAQNVRFTQRPTRYGSHNLQVSSLTALGSHIRAELETCKLWETYPRSMQKPYHSGPQCRPSEKLPCVDELCAYKSKQCV